MSKFLGCIYLIGAVIWLILMGSITLAASVFGLFGGISKLFGDIGIWQYPSIIFSVLLSLLLAFVTVKFGLSLVKSSYRQARGLEIKLSSYRSLRERRDQI